MNAGARAWREAVLLPWSLLGLALLASVRVTIEGELRVVPPPLSALVLTVLLLTVLIRSGQLAPWRLVAGGRTSLENAGGAVVLVALGWASAALIGLIIPEVGLPKLAGLVLLTALLANTLAAASGRVAAVRSLFVSCLAGFVVKFIVLDAFYSPSRGLGGRVVTALLEGVTLGGFSHVPWAPVTGYLAFGTVILYFIAIGLLPRDEALRLTADDVPALPDAGGRRPESH